MALENRPGTYSEQLDVVQDLVVEGKVVAGDEVDASLLLDLPVLQTESLTLTEKLIARNLAAPVSLSSLLQLSEATHTGEAENGAGQQGQSCLHRRGGSSRAYD